MNQRLRKKRHLGECREGWALAMRRTHLDGFDDFLDDFLEQAIDAQGIWFGGGGQGEWFSGMIDVARTGDHIKARVRHVCAWLDGTRTSRRPWWGHWLTCGTACTTTWRPSSSGCRAAEAPERMWVRRATDRSCGARREDDGRTHDPERTRGLYRGTH